MESKEGEAIHLFNVDLASMGNVLSDDLTHREYLIIPREHRRTSDIMSLAEYTAVLSIRAKHLENGAPPFVSVNTADYAEVAKQEVLQKKCPLCIRRVHSNGRMVEVWDVNELGIPFQ
jgi:DNA-directed RNA polymerase subunit K/omega